jgi:hypothetical protein
MLPVETPSLTRSSVELPSAGVVVDDAENTSLEFRAMSKPEEVPDSSPPPKNVESQPVPRAKPLTPEARMLPRSAANALMTSFKALRKAYRRAANGQAAALGDAGRILKDIGALMNEPEVRIALDGMIAMARGVASTPDTEKRDSALARAATEVRLIERLKLKRDEQSMVRDLVARGYTDMTGFPRSTEELYEVLSKGHQRYLDELKASRSQPREKKKSGKNRIIRGVGTIVLGGGAIVSNALLPALWAVSYGIGGGALVNGTRDLFPED